LRTSHVLGDRETVEAVVLSLEDELAVLDMRYAALLRDADDVDDCNGIENDEESERRWAIPALVSVSGCGTKKWRGTLGTVGVAGRSVCLLPCRAVARLGCSGGVPA
jgi:hypothetical protein